MKINKNKKIFITGGTGYVGQHLVMSLLNKGYFVYILSRKKSNLFSENENVKFITYDITDNFDFPADIDTIFHCAGAIYNTDELERVNILGTKNVVDVAIKNNCKLIYLSSAGITGYTKDSIVTEETVCHPHNPYGWSKYKAEQIVIKAQKDGLSAHILRPSTIFGTGNNKEGNSFLQLAQSMRNGLYKNIGNGIYNIVHINEVINALNLLDEKDTSQSSVYILSNPIRYRDMDKIVKNIKPKISRKTQNIPYIIAFIISVSLTILCRILKKKNPLSLNRLKALVNESVLSQDKIKRELGFKNISSIESHIENTCAEYIKIGALK